MERMKNGVMTRGVWIPPWYDENGYVEVVAIDRRGRKIYTARVFERDNIDDVRASVQRILDEFDPPPRRRRRAQP